MSPSLTTTVSARSAVLSLLLGAHPPELEGREIVAAMRLFGISESTTRAAMSRMVTSGDLVREGGRYALSERLVHRQARTDAPATTAWDGTWETAIITTSGRSAGHRAGLRVEMTRLRLAELREGVWMRPANIDRPWPAAVRDVATRFSARPEDDPVELAHTLWNLPEWSRRGHALLAAVDDAGDDGQARFLTMVALVRHLYEDPLLPPALSPADWPAEALTAAYTDFRAWLAEMRIGRG
ncbi:PaaX family transcriptional regulator C-terminal domain-containing protein [Tsukamurella spumae]|uniref:PaaX family transcriptional regulator n=1 Tax=Tsukamurella spumae TaxID=44753 RepID=A0A846WYF0_9ACTN|nr:PaaX family transcriptional regulator C-terminal domain-containing protein [Tsukamurella spumae]NKY17964.1 PaaX family transcriptional regulator [Tsukamurella spumae]